MTIALMRSNYSTPYFAPTHEGGAGSAFFNGDEKQPAETDTVDRQELPGFLDILKRGAPLLTGDDKRENRLLLLGCFATAAVEAVGVSAIAFLNGLIVDAVSQNNKALLIKSQIYWFLTYGVLAATQAKGQLWVNRLKLKLQFKITQRFISEATDASVISYFSRASREEKTTHESQRTQEDPALFSKVYGDFFYDLTRSGLKSFALAGAIYAGTGFGSLLTLGLLGYGTTIAFLASYRSRDQAIKTDLHNLNNASQDLGADLREAMRWTQKNSDFISMNGGEARIRQLLQENLDTVYHNQGKIIDGNFRVNLPDVLLRLDASVIVSGLPLMGLWYFDQISSGVLFACTYTMKLLVDDLNLWPKKLSDYKILTASAARLDKLRRTFADARQRATQAPAITAAYTSIDGLRLENISVPKPGTSEVLFTSEPVHLSSGTMLVLEGNNRVGKTCFFRELAQAIRQIPDGIAKPRFSYLGKDACLLPALTFKSGSESREQLAFFQHPTSFDDTAYERALDLVGLGKLESYDTQNQPGTRLELTLSSGDQQRLAIARLFLLKPEDRPQILVLDEALSHVDKRGRQKILDNLREAMPETIILMVLHGSSIDGAPVAYIENGTMEIRSGRSSDKPDMMKLSMLKL